MTDEARLDVTRGDQRPGKDTARWITHRARDLGGRGLRAGNRRRPGEHGERGEGRDEGAAEEPGAHGADHSNDPRAAIDLS